MYDVTESLITSNKLMTSYVAMTSYTLTRVTDYLHCDVMDRIFPTSVSNRTSDRGKSLLDTAPLHLYWDHVILTCKLSSVPRTQHRTLLRQSWARSQNLVTLSQHCISIGYCTGWNGILLGGGCHETLHRWPPVPNRGPIFLADRN